MIYWNIEFIPCIEMKTISSKIIFDLFNSKSYSNGVNTEILAPS